jgi:ribosome-associated toxin RatA of RatAB toxin-antitoxin module
VPVVVVSEKLQVPVEDVWRAVIDVESYPDRMDCVRRIECLEYTEGADGVQAAVVGWEVELDGSVLRWVEREHRDPARRQVTFEQVSGDLDVFRGTWTLLPYGDGGTEATLSVEFEIGMALLRDVLDGFATDAIRKNSAEMLRSLATV